MGERYRLVLKDAKIDLKLLSPYERLKLAETTNDEEVIKDLMNNYYRNNKIINVLLNKQNIIDIIQKLDNSALETIVGNSNCPINILEKLSTVKNRWYTRVLVLENPSCPVSVLRKLANDEDSTIRFRVAENPNCPVDILEKLSKDEDKTVRKYAINNINFKKSKLSEDLRYLNTKEAEVLAGTSKDIDILRQLAEHRYDSVLKNLVHNPNTPVDVLKKLANDENEDVRYELAHNHSTPIEVLKILANDEERWIRENVADNLNTTSDILEKLANDENKYVREKVSSNKNTPVSVLRKLANDENVRYEVAMNPSTPIDLLRKLAKNDDKWVRCGVAKNPSTPIDLLRKLTNDYYYDVRKFAKNNPNYKNMSKEELIEEILNNYNNNYSEDVVKLFYKANTSLKEKLLNIILDNIEDFDSEIIDTILASGNKRLISVIENHPNTPDEFLNK